MTPRLSLSQSSSARVVSSSDNKSHDIRRSLRRLGVQPDSHGLPYYAPSKSRTPRKDESFSAPLLEEEDDERSHTPRALSDSDMDLSLSDIHVDKDSLPIEDISNGVSGLKSLPLRRLSFEESSKGKTKSVSSCSSSLDNPGPLVQGASPSLATPTAPPTAPPTAQNIVTVDRSKLLLLFNRVVEATDGCNVDQCLRTHSTLSRLVFRHRMSLNKDKLLEVCTLIIATIV